MRKLKQPALYIEGEVEHPCAHCIVILDKLSPEEHCHGCINEASLEVQPLEAQ